MKLPVIAFLAAQVVFPAPAFDTASIKRSSPDLGGFDRENYQNGLLRMSNVTLKMLIRFAYTISEPQIIGGPKWIDETRFDIFARADYKASDTELLSMLQPLLADRFHLVLRPATRTLQGYALTVAKGGIRAPVSDPAKRPSSNTTRTSMNVSGFPLSLFAIRLSPYLGKPVADLTGDNRTFDFNLKWAEDGDPNSDAPSLFTALEEVVGLKLEARKVPVSVLVVERAELPAEN
jgi:uncharacterized protein (TIGR03435 family)